MKILVAIDRSDLAEIVLEHGLDEAVRQGGADVDVVTFVPDALDIGDARAKLDVLVRDDLEAFEVHGTITTHVLVGDPVEGIARLAREMAADLLVIGRFHVPSQSEEILALAQEFNCPTLVVGVEGPVLEAQCSACQTERRASGGERWFCAKHEGGRMPDLITRIPPLGIHGSRLW